MSFLKVKDPPLGFRFGVFFFHMGVIPNLLDIQFQKVSGLSSEIDVTSINEGGQNLYAQQLPDKVKYGNLVLERGFAVLSLMGMTFDKAMSQFRFSTANVLVMLLDESHIPLGAWLFMKAYPVKWSTSELNADNEAVVIDTMELAYTRYIKL